MRPGQVVAWLCGNTHELLEAYFGVLLAGAVLLPLNIRLAPAELRTILDDSGAVVLFRHPDQVDPEHPVRTVRLGDDHEALLARQPAGPPDTPPVDERVRGRGLLHVGLHRAAQGSDAQPPRPLPARRAQRAHDGR